jgi:uncharacterized membrane protein SpoIIM required for sporulation
MIKENRMWTDWLNEFAPLGAAGIMANNLGVGFKTYAASILPVVGTIDALMPSALQFGAINALIVKYHMTLKLWSFVAVHGVIEFTAILALLVPGERTRREALLERGATAIKLLAGCIPMLVIAGLIEGFISPTPIHPAFKFAVSGATAVGLLLYLRTPNPEGEEGRGRDKATR